MSVKATVIVPVLRQEHDWLVRCVQSAAAQTAPCDVRVAYSPDTPPETVALLETLAAEHESVRLVARDRPGFARGLNLGIAAARTERVGFLLSDDWLHPDAVRRCLERDADIVSTRLANYAEDGATPLGIVREITEAGFQSRPDHRTRAGYLSHFYLFRTEVLREAGGVDETIGDTGPDDFDLIWTLLERGASVSIVEEVLYFRRDHGRERLTLRAREKQVADLEKIFDKHGFHGPEREQAVLSHARWYGRRVQEVVEELRAEREGT